MSEDVYTVDQFRRAHFAVLPFERKALRVDRERYMDGDCRMIDVQDMAGPDSGWIPCLYAAAWENLPAEPPPAEMTREEFKAAVSRVERMVGDLTDVSAVCASFVIETGIVVADPEPTPAEQMLADLEGMNGDGFLLHHRHREIVAAQLTALGWVKEPSGETEADDD